MKRETSSRAVGLLTVAFSVAIAACGGLTCDQARHRAIKHMNQGIDAYTRGRFPAAIQELERAVAEDEGFADAHSNLARVYRAQKKWDKAERHLARASELMPGDANLYYELGVVRQKLKSPDAARLAYEKALTLNAALYKAHYRLGTVAESLDDAKGADSAYRRTIALNPKFVEAFVTLGNLYLAHGYEELAEQVLRAGASVNNESAELFNALGVASQTVGNFAEAAKALERSLQLRPGFRKAMYNLGMAYAAGDQREKAVATLRRFVRTTARGAGIDPGYITSAQSKLAELSADGGESAGEAKLPERSGLGSSHSQ